MMSNRSLGAPTTVGVESTMSRSFQTWSAVVVASSGLRTVIERSRRHPEPAIQSVLPSSPRVKLTILADSVCAVVLSAGTVLLQSAALRAPRYGQSVPLLASISSITSDDATVLSKLVSAQVRTRRQEAPALGRGQLTLARVT